MVIMLTRKKEKKHEPNWFEYTASEKERRIIIHMNKKKNQLDENGEKKLKQNNYTIKNHAFSVCCHFFVLADSAIECNMHSAHDFVYTNQSEMHEDNSKRIYIIS